MFTYLMALELLYLLMNWETFNYNRHLLSRTPKEAAKKFEIVNVRDSEKSKKKKKIVFYILENTLI